MNPLRKLAGQTAIYGLSTMVGRLLNYLLVPLYTYNFTAGEYGVVTEMYAYVSFLLIILTYGMETALFNFAQQSSDKQKVYTTALLSVVFTSLLFIVAAILFKEKAASLIRHPQHPEYVLVFALIISFDAVANIIFARLREQEKASKFAIIKTINIIINIFFNLFFIVWCKDIANNPTHAFHQIVSSFYDPTAGVAYAFVANLIASGITLLLLLPETLYLNGRFDLKLLKQMLAYALPLLFAGLAGMTNETMDRILLKYMLPENTSSVQLGIYGACYKISIIMTMFIQTYRYAAEPFFFSSSGKEGSKNIYADTMKYFVLACLIIFLGTMFNMSWIQYFVGEEFRQGLAVVPILLLANMFLGIFFNLSIWYKLTSKTRFGAYLTFFGATITLVLNLMWIPRYGYMGSAWATLICYAAMMILSYLIGQKHFPVHYELKRIFGYFTLSLTLYAAGMLIESKFASGSALVVNNVLLLIMLGFVYKFEFSTKLKRFENKDH